MMGSWLRFIVSIGLFVGAAAVTAPNTSLATIPVAYFGGHHSACNFTTGCRTEENLRMLSKMRIVMVEKWEGHCYDSCMKNGSSKPSLPCFPSCNVEGDMRNTLRRAKAMSPNGLTGVFYLNTLMAFPFYSLAGKFTDANALLMDQYTGKPVLLTNDENMQNIWVYDWGNPKGRELFLNYIKEMIHSGDIDGIFADKWGYKCKEENATAWKICNNRCGYVTPEQGQAYNNGSVTIREQVSALFHTNSTSPATFGGLLYADGLSNSAKCPKVKVALWLRSVSFVPFALLHPPPIYTTPSRLRHNIFFRRLPTPMAAS
jgi:hypothetical protein